MWRAQNSRDEWERRKSYLVRSLFEDRPLLSPIYEGHESSPSPCSDRSESPLPELVIEIVKKQLHDETEEFYVKLQKEIRRLYERDFLNIYYSKSSDTMNEEFMSPFSEHSSENLVQSENPSYFYRASLGSNKIEDEGGLHYMSQIEKQPREHYYIKDENYGMSRELLVEEEESSTVFTEEESEMQETSQSLIEGESNSVAEEHSEYSEEGTSENIQEEEEHSENIGSEELTEKKSKSFPEDHSEFLQHDDPQIKAKDHSRMLEGDESKKFKEVNDDTPRQSSDSELDINVEIITEEPYNKCLDVSNQANTNLVCAIASPSNLSEANMSTDLHKSSTSEQIKQLLDITEIEKLANTDDARKQSYTSLICLPEPELMRRHQTSVFSLSYEDVPADDSILSHETGTTRQIELESPDMSKAVSTSTPKSETSFTFKITQKRFRKEPDQPLKKFCSEALQTSFSDDGEDFWKDFFVGKPIVYRVCSCLDHVCPKA